MYWVSGPGAAGSILLGYSPFVVGIMAANIPPESVGLPPQTFLYTLDQIAGMLQLSMEHFCASYVYFTGRSTGRKRPDEMNAFNIAPSDKTPDWRIAQQEFIRWLKQMGLRVHSAPVRII